MLHLSRFLALLCLGEGELRQGEAHLCLGELEGSLVGEVLPRLGIEKLRLGKPRTTAWCCFLALLYIVQDGFRKSS